jgi:SAM-dependent methyltransferase
MDSSSAFDPLAPDYDRSFTRSACGMTLRAMVWERLPRVFGARQCILEIGCGTGEDAIRLARSGHRVLAIDASPEMIRIARLRAMAAGCAERIEFHVMPAEALHTLPRARRFDGVFSNFGAINCVADVARLARSLAARMSRGAPLLFVVMGRHVPWEWAWYLARGDRRRAFRRLDRAGVRWRGMTIHYPTPSGLSAALAPMFLTRRRSALGFVLPPSYAAHWLDSRPRMLAALAGVERLTQRVTAGLADHYVLEAECAAPGLR